MVTDNDRAYVIREIRKDEFVLLKDFLYEAIFIPEGVTPPLRSILDQPELRVYIDDFGSGKGIIVWWLTAMEAWWALCGQES